MKSLIYIFPLLFLLLFCTGCNEEEIAGLNQRIAALEKQQKEEAATQKSELDAMEEEIKVAAEMISLIETEKEELLTAVEENETRNDELRVQAQELPPAWDASDFITLSNGKEINARIKNYTKGVFTIDTDQGEKKAPYKAFKSIRFRHTSSVEQENTE